MPEIEGLTPTMLWITLFGVLCICGIFLIGFNVYKAINYVHDRKKAKQKEEREKIEAQKPDFAEKVSKKVIAELGPRFEEIEDNLRKDKSRLETHETLIASMQTGQKEIHDGLRAICKFMLVISNYGNLGQDERIKDAHADLQKFLAEKL